MTRLINHMVSAGIVAFFACCSLDANTLSDPTKPANIQGMKLTTNTAKSASKWTLHSTLVANDRRIAIINNTLVSEGEFVDSAEVLTINRLHVVVRASGKRITLPLVPTIRSKRP